MFAPDLFIDRSRSSGISNIKLKYVVTDLSEIEFSSRSIVANSPQHTLMGPPISTSRPILTPYPSQQSRSLLGVECVASGGFASSRESLDENPLKEWSNVEKMLRCDALLDVAYLILLMNALGGSSIPKALFLRGNMTQMRWNDSGDVEEVGGVEAGLDQQLIIILADTETLDRTLDLFVKCGTLYSLGNQLQANISQFLSDQAKTEWAIRALTLICFVFPRD
jgi:tetratricopeptide (TPR) repeat protein